MGTQYLLDSNICIHFMKGRADVVDAIRKVGWSNCHIAEISVAELLFGAECSANRDKNTELVEAFLQNVHIVPFSVGIREFCKQKAQLRAKGELIEDTDLFIGAAAIASGYTLVTENVKHLSRLKGIQLENWIKRP